MACLQQLIPILWMPEPGSLQELRARALSCLSRREYSRDELYRKLAPYTEDPDELNGLLEDLKTRGWLSDQRFVEQIVHARQGKFGSQRVAYELRQKGVAEELIGTALEQVKEGELDSARTVWQRKFGRLPVDAKDQARQMRFLQSRGFSGDIIRKVLRYGDDGVV